MMDFDAGRHMTQKRLPGLLFAFSKRASQTAKVGVVTFGRQVIHQRQLHGRAGGQRTHQLQLLNTARMFSRRHPANTETGHQTLGE